MAGGGNVGTEIGFRFGTMTADLTRDTFNPAKHFVRVVMQQGRVQLDSDWNEQAAILLHYVQSLAADLIGPHGGPGTGFNVGHAGAQPAAFDFMIAAGHYYVDGILCENEADITYDAQPGFPFAVTETKTLIETLVYLDVWERHISAVEDDSIREVALDGPDTTTRSQVVWQARSLGLASESDIAKAATDLVKARTDLGAVERNNNIIDIRTQRQRIADAESWLLFRLTEQLGRDPSSLPGLRARARQPSTGTPEPCIIPPDAKYRGPENQLYRVQVHTGGHAGTAGTATFKWSRENGSVIFPILRVEGKVLALQHLGRDRRGGLQPGDWIEVEDDDYVLRGATAPLRQVQAVDEGGMTVTLDQAPALAIDPEKHPLVRRWDHGRADPTNPGAELAADGAVTLIEGSLEEGWMDLEDGVQVQFRNQMGSGSDYRSGDYWLIPARTATADVEWPQVAGATAGPASQPPRGIHHHYAPLALISADGGMVTDLRRTIPSLDAIFS
jgi:hypothetical protein